MPAVVYTMFGGVQAVTWTDVKIMVLIVVRAVRRDRRGGPRFARRASASADGLGIAAATGRLRTFDFSFDLTNQYTFWSGTIAALFLFCSYFGTDQSQVQRYLTARSVDEARHSLLMSAYWKIPLQVLVLVLGVLVFVFYVFNPPPLLFSTVARGAHAARARPLRRTRRCRRSSTPRSRRGARRPRSWRRRATQATPAGVPAAKTRLQQREAALQARARQGDGAGARERATTGDFTDVNYIIPTFILTQLPIGLDRPADRRDHHGGDRHDRRRAELAVDGDRHRLLQAALRARPPRMRTTCTVSKIATGVWGLFACAVAVWAAELGSLIEVVNRFGSFFYGSILGVFILAVGFPRATGNGAFVGLMRRHGVGGVGGIVHTTSPSSGTT